MRCQPPGALLLSLAVAAVAGCGSGEPGGPPGGFGDKPVTVELITVTPQLLSDRVAFSGELAAEYAVVVNPEISGVVESIEFKEGQAVVVGDILFRLRDAEQRARLKEAEAERSLAQDVFDRTQRLASRDVSSEARRSEAIAGLDRERARVDLAKLELERTRIRAPFDGAVGQRMVSPGDRVTPDDGLVQILAIDRLQLLFAVPEVGVPLAREGIPVFIRVVAWPGEIFPGEVFFVSPNLEVGSRRLILKAWVANEAHRLKPGMFANVDVEIGRKEEALLVPEAAVVYDRNGVYLWRRGEENRAEKIPVEIGIRSEGKVEILSGIAPGDSVVSAGIHKVKAGTVLQIQEPGPATATPIHASDGGGAEGGAGGDAS